MQEQQQNTHQPGAQQEASIVEKAVAEAAKPDADTDSAYECPFCVMMRKGGCEDVFKAFMECGEKADKGNMEMSDCLPQFESLHLCMEKNKAVFDGLLQEMQTEDDKRRGSSSLHSEQQQPQQADKESDSSRAQQSERSEQQQQQQQQQQMAGASTSSIPLGGSMAGAS